MDVKKTSRNLVGLILIMMMFFPGVGFAQTLEKTMDQLAGYIVQYTPGENANRNLSIQLINSRSGLSDPTSAAIASQLELALRRHLLKNKSFTESIDPYEVQITGSYRSLGEELELAVIVTHKNSESGDQQGFERSVRFEYSGESQQKRVLILNIASNDLTPQLMDKFSNDLRKEIEQRGIYIPEKRPFQSSTIDCSSSVCLSAMGRQLDVHYILQPRLEKTSNLKYSFSANLVDVKKKKSITKVAVMHSGRIAFLKGSLDDLVTRLSLQETLQAAVASGIKRETGHLSITSLPSGADIYLDNERLDEVTNILLENVEAGMHSISIRRGTLQRNLKIVLEAGETKRLHVELKPFEVQSLKLLKNPEDPLLNGFKIKYSLPVDPQSVNQKTFFVQKGQHKIAGSLEVMEDTILFKPLKPLHHGKLYKIIATRSVRSSFGDAPDLLYERRYKTTPYPVEKDANVLIYSESHGSETWSKYKRGVLKLGISSFMPLKHFDINGQRISLKDQTIIEYEIPFDFEKSGKERLSYLVTA